MNWLRTKRRACSSCTHWPETSFHHLLLSLENFTAHLGVVDVVRHFHGTSEQGFIARIVLLLPTEKQFNLACFRVGTSGYREEIGLGGGEQSLILRLPPGVYSPPPTTPIRDASWRRKNECFHFSPSACTPKSLIKTANRRRGLKEADASQTLSSVVLIFQPLFFLFRYQHPIFLWGTTPLQLLVHVVG